MRPLRHPLPLIFFAALLLAAAPVFAEASVSEPASAQESSSASGAVLSGSGTDVWQLRSERARGFGDAWGTFAPVFLSWQGKWQKAREKLLTHIDRCHTIVRSANRDTLLPVTAQCERGQLLLEQDALKREREVIKTWPGISEDVRTEALGKIDLLLGAIQPVIDAVDAKVFSSIAALKDVRANLLTQYRRPYWLAEAHLRADAARTWLAFLLLKLQSLAAEPSLTPETAKIASEAFACYESADPLLAMAASSMIQEESFRKFREAAAMLKSCSASLNAAQKLSSSVVP